MVPDIDLNTAIKKHIEEVLANKKNKIVEMEEVPELDLNNIKLPYVIPNRILMSPGRWNGFLYNSEVIKNAFENSEWEDKYIRSLFLDHMDERSADWVGEVRNIHMEGDDVRGDLVIVDLPTAIKLAYGAKMGISPKVIGQEEDKIMYSFKFDNFSVVINPAVKTAYINNSEVRAPSLNEIVMVNAQITDMEAKRKQLGMTPAQFYAVPRDPPSSSKLPIFDAAHVRNAMARFNQVKGVSAEEKATAKRKIIAAAKRFGIEVGEFEKVNQEEHKMAEEEQPKPEEQPEVKVEEAPVEEPKVEEPVAEAPVAEEPEVDAPVEESAPEPVVEAAPAEVENSEETVTLSDIKSLLSELIAAVQGLKTVKNEEAPVVSGPVEVKTEASEVKAEMSEKDAQIQELSEKLEKAEKLLNEPDKATVKTEELSAVKKEYTARELDENMIRMLKNAI